MTVGVSVSSTSEAPGTGPFVCGPDHKHGETSTCQTLHGCRCQECREAHTEYKFYRENMRRAGRWDRSSDVDGTGTRRRIQALAYTGWSTPKLAAALNTTQGQAWSLTRKERVTAETRDRVKVLFAAQWDKEPPGGRNKRSMNNARQLGWVGPLAFDDIDDPTEIPNVRGDKATTVDEVAIERALHNRKQRLNHAEKCVAVARAHGWRWSDLLIANRLRISDKTVVRIRGELGLHAWEVGEQVNLRDVA